jgi:hypothetical protein
MILPLVLIIWAALGNYEEKLITHLVYAAVHFELVIASVLLAMWIRSMKAWDETGGSPYTFSLILAVIFFASGCFALVKLPELEIENVEFYYIHFTLYKPTFYFTSAIDIVLLITTFICFMRIQLIYEMIEDESTFKKRGVSVG